MIQFNNRTTLRRIVMGVLLLGFSLGILSQILLASQMRLSGDDYCYNAVLAGDGFWGMQKRSYLEIATYNGNRYALNFLSGLAGLFPVGGTPFLLITSLLLWLVGLTGLVFQLSRYLNLGLRHLEGFLIAEGFICLALWSAPNLDQSFFWRSGMLPYFMPLVGGTWLIYFVLRAGSIEKPRWYVFGLLFLMAVAVGGFSETGAMLQLGFWGLCLIWVLLARISDRKIPGRWIRIVAAPLIGSLVAFALLYFSPSTALRWEEIPERLSFGAFLSLFFTNLKVYFWQAVMRRSVYLIIPILFGFGFNILFLPAVPATPNWKKMLLWLLGLGVVTAVLVGCVFLPATYVFADYPPDRALILSQMVLIIAELGSGLWLGETMKGLGGHAATHRKKKVTQVFSLGITLLLLTSVMLAPFNLVQHAISEWPLVHRWTQLWDSRHQTLVDAGLNNKETIHVMELDHVIADIADLSPDPDYWYNNCAEMYYGIDTIYADLPGW